MDFADEGDLLLKIKKKQTEQTVYLQEWIDQGGDPMQMSSKEYRFEESEVWSMAI